GDTANGRSPRSFSHGTRNSGTTPRPPPISFTRSCASARNSARSSPPTRFSPVSRSGGRSWQCSSIVSGCLPPRWPPPPERAPAARRFPAAGETFGDFLLLAELGRGAQGPVFLASQLSLGDRPVVLKLTPCEAGEHLSLARLQHTHIVPLYSVQDHPARGLRALCMPYFGGATLARLLEALRGQPPARRTGQDLLDALDRAQAAAPLVPPAPPPLPPPPAGGGVRVKGPARQTLAGASYVEAVCWVGACVADALQYAHERGLVHLDLKPSNVLLAADAQPMLLDFHLARGPIHP